MSVLADQRHRSPEQGWRLLAASGVSLEEAALEIGVTAAQLHACDALLATPLKLMTQRAEKAERALSSARDDLAATKKSLGELHETLEGQKIRLHGAQRHLEALEVELAEAKAEAEILRLRSFLGPSDGIRRARKAAAERMRDLQSNRRPLTDDEPG